MIYLLRKHDIISVPIIREAYIIRNSGYHRVSDIIRFRRERISLKKSACKASGFFLVGEDGFVCIFIPLWGMKIEVLTPSSRRQATVRRTVAFWIFESASLHPNAQKDQSKKDWSFCGGGGRIRTIEAKRSRFTVCPLWPLGNSPVFGCV